MNRQLTRRVFFEKTKTKINYVTNAELVSVQTIFTEPNFIPSKILLIGLRFEEESLADNVGFLTPKKMKQTFEEIQDELSIRMWDLLKEELLSFKSRDYDTTEIQNEFLNFLLLNPKYNFKSDFLSIIDLIREDRAVMEVILPQLVTYKLKFTTQSLDFSNESSDMFGVLCELYFQFHQYCIEKSYKLKIYTIKTAKLNVDKYKSEHYFMIRFCFSDVDGNYVPYNSADFN